MGGFMTLETALEENDEVVVVDRHRQWEAVGNGV